MLVGAALLVPDELGSALFYSGFAPGDRVGAGRAALGARSGAAVRVRAAVGARLDLVLPRRPGLRDDEVAPLFMQTNGSTGDNEFLALEVGLVLTALAGPPVVVAVWRQGERSLPAIVLGLGAGFLGSVAALIVFSL